MSSTTQAIKKHFPEEKIKQEIDVRIMSSKQSVFSIPVEYHRNINPFASLRGKLVETNNYYFLDIRENVAEWQIVIAILIILFQFLLQFSLTFALISELMLLFYTFVRYTFFVKQSLTIKVYKKSWSTIDRVNNQITLNINMPKYSRDAIYKYLYQFRFLDFLGVTVSSAPIKLNYKFEVDRHD